MFEELPFIIGFLLFSIIVSYVLLTYVSGFFKKIIVGLMVVGIVIHELFHLLMCLITNTPVESVKLLEKIKTEGPDYKTYEFNGRVSIKKDRGMSFLQAVLVGFAPLFFSFWLFFFLLDKVIHPANEIIFFTSLFIVLSIMFSAAPSSEDLKCIPKAFGENVGYSMYQILLLLLSFSLVWLTFPVFNQIYFHEIIIYTLIGIFYYTWKYGIKMVSFLYKFVIPNYKLKKI